MTKVGINGFGRIGRLVSRAPMKRDDLEVVAINDLTDVEYMTYIFKYGSVYGRPDGTVDVQDGMLVVNGRKIRVMAEKEPRLINWDVAGVKYVVGNTGRLLTRELSQGHIEVGAKYVVMSALSKDDIPMLVTGANLEKYVCGTQLVPNASHTTNCLAPLVKVLDDSFGVEQGLMTTVHAATATQKMVDGPSLKDWRGGRPVIGNIIPSSTGVAKVVGKMIPKPNGKLTGMFFRVPTMGVLVVDLTVQLKRGASYDEICATMKKASETNPKGIMEYCDELLVSQDFISGPYISILDVKAGIALTDTSVKVVAWYNNEWGHSNKVLCLTAHMAEVNKQSR